MSCTVVLPRRAYKESLIRAQVFLICVRVSAHVTTVGRQREETAELPQRSHGSRVRA